MSPTPWLSLSISRRRSLSRISPFPIPRGRCSRHPEPSRGIPRRYLKAFATGSLDCARDDRKVEARSRQLATQNLSRARERGIDVRADVVETDSIYEAGMKQHFHRLRLDAAEEKLSAFAIKFLERNLERVQPGGVNCRYGTYSKNHDAWHTQGARGRTRASPPRRRKTDLQSERRALLPEQFFREWNRPPAPARFQA